MTLHDSLRINRVVVNGRWTGPAEPERMLGALAAQYTVAHYVIPRMEWRTSPPNIERIPPRAEINVSTSSVRIGSRGRSRGWMHASDVWFPPLPDVAGS